MELSTFAAILLGGLLTILGGFLHMAHSAYIQRRSQIQRSLEDTIEASQEITNQTVTLAIHTANDNLTPQKIHMATSRVMEASDRLSRAIGQLLFLRDLDPPTDEIFDTHLQLVTSYYDARTAAFELLEGETGAEDGNREVIESSTRDSKEANAELASAVFNYWDDFGNIQKFRRWIP